MKGQTRYRATLTETQEVDVSKDGEVLAEHTDRFDITTYAPNKRALRSRLKRLWPAANIVEIVQTDSERLVPLDPERMEYFRALAAGNPYEK